MHVLFSHHWAVFISALVTPLYPSVKTKPAKRQEGVPFTVRMAAELSQRQQSFPVYSYQSVVEKRPFYMIMPCSPERHKNSIKSEICLKLTPITCCYRGNCWKRMLCVHGNEMNMLLFSGCNLKTNPRGRSQHSESHRTSSVSYTTVPVCCVLLTVGCGIFLLQTIKVCCLEDDIKLCRCSNVKKIIL